MKTFELSKALINARIAQASEDQNQPREFLRNHHKRKRNE